MKPSHRQQAVLDTWLKKSTNILINAVAGSGKTSTLFLLLKSLKKKTLFLAFNKSIQTEIENKMQSMSIKHGKSMTLHSLGFMSIKYSLKNKIKVENGKNWRLIKELQNSSKTIYGTLKNYEEKQRVNFTIMDMNDISRIYLTEDYKKILNILTNMDKNPFEFEYLEKLWIKFINIRDKEYETQVNTGSVVHIDFIDMIYLPANNNWIIPIDPKILMIDECQDLNLAQHRLVDNLIKQGHVQRWIAVGDRNQAIYGFSGAFASSFDLFKTKGDNVQELPLDICYRCSKDIVVFANKVYDIMIPFKSTLGTVKDLTSLPTDEVCDIINKYPESMIICRNKGPLFTMYFELLGRDIPCKLVGEDILSSLLRFLSPKQNLTIDRAKSVISNEYLELSTKQDTEENKIKLFILKENFSNFNKITENFNLPDNTTVKELIEKVRTMFDDSPNSISLCSIHKSKGLEADTVFILNEELIPSKFAKSQSQLIQEKNLKYVARTRAKENMYFIGLKEN